MRIATLGGTASIEYSISVIPGRRFYPCRKHLFNYRDKRKSQRNQRDAAFPGADQPQCGRPDSSRRPGGSECVVLLHRHGRGKCRQPPLWVWGHGFAAQVLLLACCSQETMSAEAPCRGRKIWTSTRSRPTARYLTAIVTAGLRGLVWPATLITTGTASPATMPDGTTALI